MLAKLIEQIPSAGWLAIAGWLAYELRQWRVWWQDQHGGAPDKADAPPK